MIFRSLQHLLIVLGMLVLPACEQDQRNSTSGTGSGQQQENGVVISGVSSKGPIQGATINVFAMDSNGIKTGAALASTTSDGNGAWQVNISPAPTAVLLVESSGGSYVDEADPSPTNKRTIALGPTDIIEGVLFPGQSTASITLLTDALLEKSRAESSTTDIQAVLSNNRNNAIAGLGFDPFSVAATNPVAPSTAASDDSIEYAMYLGGIATALNSAAIILGQPAPGYAIMMGMVQDLSDGRLDGLDGNGTVTVLVNGQQQSFPGDLDLNQSILRFRNNNFHAYAATAVQTPVTVNENTLAQPGTNTFPIATDDIVVTGVDTAVTISNALSNDSDPDGDALSVAQLTQPVNGTVTQPSNGVFVYAPNTGFSGSDAFSYTVEDGRGGSDTAAVIINVQQTVSNLSPVAFAGNDLSVLEQSAVTINGSGQDADGSITGFNWSQTSGPTVTLNSTDTPSTGFNAPDITAVATVVLTLTVTDNQGLTGSDSVVITINPVTAAPVASAGNDVSVDEQSTISLSGSGSADTGLTIASFNWVQVSGTPVTLNNAATATPSFTSPLVTLGNIEVLVFQLTVTDNVGNSGFDFVTFLVNPVLVAPTANAGPDQNADELALVSLSGSGTDDGSITGFSWTQVSPATPQAILSNPNIANPTFTAPDIANSTTFTFQLTVTDDEGGTATDTVNINLASLNAGPTLVDDPGQSTPEDTPVVLNTLLNNDTDPEGDSLTIDSVTQPANGTVVIEANNLDITYTPDLNFNGSDSFTYTAIDAQGALSTNSATVTVNVAGTNDNPVAVTDTGSVIQGFPLTIANLTANDTDPEGDTLSISGITQPANGVTTNNGDGTVTYTPDLAFNGVDSFTYSIVDGNGGSATGVVNVTVIPDSDGDGIVDTDEGPGGTGTDPNLADTDGDGFYDNHEILLGTNPNLNTEFPPNPLAGSVISAANANNVITVDTTWSLSASPFLVTSDVSIQSGATLTIEPGVVVKLANNVDFSVNAGGVLDAQGNAPVPQQVVFTSDHDDSINGDTNNDGVATNPAAGDWNGIDFNLNSDGTLRHATVKNAVDCILIANSSPVIDHVDVGDCTNNGIEVTVNSGTRTANLSFVTVNDYDGNGSSTNIHGIQVLSSSSATTVLNISDISISDAGNTSGDFAIDILGNGGHISGTVDRVTIVNPINDGINIRNNSSGDVSIAMSNISVDGSGGNSLDVRDQFATSGLLSLSIDGVNSFTNNLTTATAVYFENNDPDFLASGSTTIDTAGYGLQLNNSAGVFRNITMNNTLIAGMRLQNASAPTFDTIVLTNAITPYELVGQDLSAIVNPAQYNFSDASVSKSYIRILGTFPANMTLTPDPLNTGGAGPESVWRVPETITIPSGVTLTIEDGAIVKFDLSRLLLMSGGSLVVGDGDGIGANAILTSIRDDSVGADLGDPTAPAAGNWNYIQLNNGSSVNIDNAIIRYANRGIYQPSTAITGFTVTNTEIHEFNTYGMDLTSAGIITYTLDNVLVSNANTSTNNSDGIRVANSGGPHAITLQFNDVTVDRVGNDINNDRGIEIFLNSNSTLDGALSNITISNAFGTGLLLQNTTGGLVNPVISGLNITNPGSGRYGLQLIGNNDGQTQPTINGSVATNLIGDSVPGSGGFYGMLVQGVAGNYSDITINNTTSSSLFISGATNPASWDDATIVLNDSPSPWTIRTLFPPSIGVLGTADLGYDTVSSTVDSRYVQLNSTLADTVLVADPLNTGGVGPASVWYVDSDIIIPAGVTLTINDGAIVKFSINRLVSVNGGTLVVGDPAGTNDGAGIGPQAILTSARDNSVGADPDLNDNAAPAVSDWLRIDANSSSTIAIDNAIIRYMDYAVHHNGVTPLSVTLMNSTVDQFFEWGLFLRPFGDITYTLNNVTVSNGTRRDGIHIEDSTAGNTITLDFDDVTVTNVGDSTDDDGIELLINSGGLLTGRLDNITVDGGAGPGFRMQNTGSGLVNPVLSGFNVTNPGTFGIQLIGNSDGQTVPTLDNSSGNPNLVGNANAGSGGQYGLLVQGVDGIFNNISIRNTTGSGLFISGISNPSVWDDASIVINDSPSPWTIRTLMPPIIGTLGTDDLGYNLISSNVPRTHAQVNGTLSDTLLVADPLNSGNSVWYVDSDITVPAGATLTINDGAIVKLSINRLLSVNGSLVIGDPAGTNDGAGIGPQAILTSSRDDTVGADPTPADSNPPARSDWLRIDANASSSVAIDNAILRYMDYGVHHNGVTPLSVTVLNSTIDEFLEWGLYLRPFGSISYIVNNVVVSNGTRRDGIHIEDSTSGNMITVDFDDVLVTNVGDTTDDNGIDLLINSGGLLTGRFDNVTIDGTAGTGLLLQNTGSGLVNPAFSGINVLNPGVHGVQLVGSVAAATVPTFDGVSGTSVIGDPLVAGSGGDLGITFQGVDGSYSDIEIHSTNLSALYFSGDANPSFGLNITLDNSPSPYTLIGMALPTGVNYASGANLVEDYARISGALTGDLTLGANPLGAGTFWRIPTSGSFDLEVPNGVTLTIAAGAVLKFETGADLTVQSGGTLNVNGTSGNHVVMTSETDARLAGSFDLASGNSSFLIDWEGVNFNAGSAGGSINFLDIWYARDGIDFNNVTSNPTFNNLTVNYCQDGLRINSSTSMTLTFNNLAMNENSSNHLVLEGNGSLATTFTESTPDGLTITDVPGNGADATHGIFISNTDSTNVVAGFTVDGTSNALRYASSGANIAENNILRNARSDGINHTSNGNPLIRNNIVVQNNGSGMFISGGNGNVFGNLIRQNSRNAGAGVFINSSSVTLENNLIVENRSTSNTSNSGGSGIYINGNSSPTIINNTVANNVSADAANFEGAGINVESSAGAITLRDNILFGNTDLANGANDLYDDVGRITTASNNLIGALLASPGANLYIADATDLIGIDPLFVQGWYLSSTIEGPVSPATDAGSTNASAVLPIALNARTTSTGGGLDGTFDGAIVNLGYHYAGAFVPASAANTTVVSNPPSPVNTISGTPVVITVTPRDAGGNVIGAGLNVDASIASGGTSTGVGSTSGTNSTMSSVRDLGDGSYQVTFTPDSGTALVNEIVSFSVNGVAISTTIDISWQIL